MTINDWTAIFSGIFGNVGTKTPDIKPENPDPENSENEDLYDYDYEYGIGQKKELKSSGIIWIAVIITLIFIGIVGYEIYRRNQAKK